MLVFDWKRHRNMENLEHLHKYDMTNGPQEKSILFFPMKYFKNNYPVNTNTLFY